MQCSCGGTTIDKYVTKNYIKIGRFAECTACFRILWIINPYKKSLYLIDYNTDTERKNINDINELNIDKIK